jgi:AAA domain
MYISGKRPGKVISFYSYKGGVGRSLMVANIALILASNNKQVLVIDWDLEAPGLHRYFAPFLDDPSLSATPGLLDLFTNYYDTAASLIGDDPDAEKRTTPLWDATDLDFLNYAQIFPGELTKPIDGKIYFVGAGKQDEFYSSQVAAFDWEDFYAAADGSRFVDALMERARAEYDYILVDSRTGVSDTSGICTVQIPDALVVCFTYNNQSALGAEAIARSAFHQRQTHARNSEISATTSRPRDLAIIPMPTRIDETDPRILDGRRKKVWELFDWTLELQNVSEKKAYWFANEVLYESHHSYVEELAFLSDSRHNPRSMLSKAGYICSQLTDGEITEWKHIFTYDELQAIQNAFEFGGTYNAPAQVERRQATASEERTQFDVSKIVHEYFQVFSRLIIHDGGVYKGSKSVPEASFPQSAAAQCARLVSDGILTRVESENRNISVSSEFHAQATGLFFTLTSSQKDAVDSVERIGEIVRLWVTAGRDRLALFRFGKTFRTLKIKVSTLSRQSLLNDVELSFFHDRERLFLQLVSACAFVTFAVVTLVLVGASQNELRNTRASVDEKKILLENSEKQRLTLGEQLKLCNVKTENQCSGNLSYETFVGRAHLEFSKKKYAEAIVAISSAADSSQGLFDRDLFRLRALIRERQASVSSNVKECTEFVIMAYVDWTRFLEEDPNRSLDKDLELLAGLRKNGLSEKALERLSDMRGFYLAPQSIYGDTGETQKPPTPDKRKFDALEASIKQDQKSISPVCINKR